MIPVVCIDLSIDTAECEPLLFVTPSSCNTEVCVIERMFMYCVNLARSLFLMFKVHYQMEW